MLASVCFADTSARADLPGDAPIQPVDARTLLAEPVLLDQSSTTAWNDPGNASATLMATQPSNPPQSYAERSIAEIIGHFSGYEPMYFIAGPYNPDVKFQFSFKYALFNKDAPLSKQIPLISGLHFAYTQLNLWKLGQPSTAFYDTNYMPEFFYSNEDIRAIHLPGVAQLGLQTGIGHDSNGQGNTNERAINILFLRPILDFGDPENFHFYIAPKAYVYIVDVEDNPDIAKFRGYCDFTSVIGWRQGLELSFLGRIGSDYNRGCVQFDLTFPVRDVLDHNLDLYLDAQYFNGYGESLLSYNRRTQAFRIGVALVR
jgi:outer membrane phospholipase A